MASPASGSSSPRSSKNPKESPSRSPKSGKGTRSKRKSQEIKVNDIIATEGEAPSPCPPLDSATAAATATDKSSKKKKKSKSSGGQGSAERKKTRHSRKVSSSRKTNPPASPSSPSGTEASAHYPASTYPPVAPQNATSSGSSTTSATGAVAASSSSSAASSSSSNTATPSQHSHSHHHHHHHTSHQSTASKSSSSTNEYSARRQALQAQLRHSGKTPTIADFQLIETLGTGTFGRVFLVKHSHSQQYFAMKILRKHDIVRLKQVDHIKNERDILGYLHHPFLVSIYSAFQDTNHLYMVLEYVIGGEIFSHLRRAGRFSADVSRFYAAEIVLALEHMHSHNIIYRDLKPENILLDADGHIKITDFGFAKRVEDRTWTLCGTPEYLAPEIIQSQGHDKAVDWWALGIFLYEMLAGHPPFFDDNPFGIYEKILAGKLVFPPHFDRHAQDLIRKLLAPNKASRLGNLRSGADDVKKHRWFKTIDWERLQNREIKAPIIPRVSGEGDTQNFEEYDEDWDLHEPLPAIAAEVFQDFVDYV